MSDPHETAANRRDEADKRFKWFSSARFGMFVHWGLYSLLGGRWDEEDVEGIGECIMSGSRIPVRSYEKLAARFNPARFDADAWVKLAKSAGMRYIVITAKHVEGFAMYDSKASPYNIVAATPFGRDPMKELAGACRRHGLRLGFYYSQALDLHDPDGVGNTWDYPDEDKKDFAAYLERKVKPQLRELLTNYGPVGLIWFDVPTKITRQQSESLAELVRELQPDCLVNSRVGHGAGDYISTEDNGIPVGRYDGPWETPATMNDTWGYKANDTNWKTPRTLIRNLVDIVSKGGNYLLNVGPTGEGDVPAASVRCLREIGEWMARNGESIHGAGPGPLPRQFVYRWGRCTARPDRLFLHVFDSPADNALFIPGVRSEVKRAYVLGDPDRTPLKLTRLNGNDIRVEIPPPGLVPGTLSDIDTVVSLEFDGPADVDPRPLAPADEPTVLHAFEARIHGRNARYADGVWEACQAISETWADGAEAWTKVPERVRYDRIACIANWRDRDDWVSWQVRVTNACACRLELTYAADAEAQGGEYVAEIGGQTFPAKVRDTGGRYDFKTFNLGRVTFPAPGGYELSVRPRRIAGDLLMNLKSASLTRER